MILEQNNSNYIDLEEVDHLSPEQFDSDYSHELSGKYTILVIFKNTKIGYLKNVFATREDAQNWIEEIFKLKEFEVFLNSYKF